MKSMLTQFEARLEHLSTPLRVQLPSGHHLGPRDAPVQLTVHSALSLPALLDGQIGTLASAIVEGQVSMQGSMRDVMAVASELLPEDPRQPGPGRWLNAMGKMRSLAQHTLQRDAQQIQFHYDISDAFYALWLDPLRVYSCAYFREPGMTLAQAQQAKLDHICRKLQLQRGERLLDIGCGWGGLLLWAAKHYGVQGKGITLSHNQYRYANALIEQEGLQGQVSVQLQDYREVSEGLFDKICSVGMFEHVGRANLAAYFGAVQQQLQPGGMALIHGITAGGVEHAALGAGLGDFIGRYIFPGGELLHVSAVLHDMALAGLEMVDTENLRPHYARTLWAWSDALEAQLPQALHALQQRQSADQAARSLRAYRLYLAGCAMGFERGWMGLHQMLAIAPDGDLQTGALRGAQSSYSFERAYMYR